jgi:superfamily II helicase
MTFRSSSCRPSLEEALSVVNKCQICLTVSVVESILNRFRTKYKASNICDAKSCARTAVCEYQQGEYKLAHNLSVIGYLL